ncbi:SIS domain-containing protein [Enterococcus hulanensis]|uniref:SIS domain-containing protein n=1 Tax=Enterococcus TaxID=1350 RepID=UPI000B5AA282|nr:MULTISPECIES: SIS domain-containing protein [Enterococcus]MBO0413142.1 SIS domain-containing protein [Enterococcus hulanensis]OTO15234.1 6-phospho 3-hexuloisomerase [Enterococcus sp. 3H8_DIV0648]
MSIQGLIKNNIDELNEIQQRLDETQLTVIAGKLIGANRIFFSGMGRSGNMVKALAIRFMHLGYDAYVAGDAATPSISKGDVLVAVSSSGKTNVTMNHLETAKKNGGTTVLISSVRENPERSDCYLCIPAKTEVASTQHAGSLFEQSVLIVGDALSSYIQSKENISTEYMNDRHANLQ